MNTAKVVAIMSAFAINADSYPGGSADKSNRSNQAWTVSLTRLGGTKLNASSRSVAMRSCRTSESIGLLACSERSL